MTDCIENIPLFDPPRDPFVLYADDGWPETWHEFDDQTVWAVQAAFATGRPLLIRGEPGIGKSQVARATAQVLNRAFLYEVITARTEVTDLLWQFDAVARLGEAQVLNACGVKSEQAVREALALEKFLIPGKIWWALNWEDAFNHVTDNHLSGFRKDTDKWRNGCVLLIDEIDKADSELPNALLECFANTSFQVPNCGKTVMCHADQPAPLVVVTTNEERELPAAFLRRCLVLTMTFPGDSVKAKAFLIQRGKVHYKTAFSTIVPDFDDVLEQAADMLLADRARTSGVALPGHAEYLDLCKAAFTISLKNGEKGCDILERVRSYTLRKNVD